MKQASRWVAVVWLSTMLVPAGAQREDRSPFRPLDGYEEARFGGQTLTITSRGVARKVSVSFTRVRVAPPSKSAVVRLPGAGVALAQHGAGDAKVATTAVDAFEPLPGEWLRLQLPNELRITIGSDTALLDLILVQDAGS